MRYFFLFALNCVHLKIVVLLGDAPDSADAADDGSRSHAHVDPNQVNCGPVSWKYLDSSQYCKLPDNHPGVYESPHVALHHSAHLNGPLDWLLLFLPSHRLSRYCELTSAEIEACTTDVAQHNRQKLTPEELLKYIGIRLVIVRDPIHESVKHYWHVAGDESPNELFAARNFFERFGMSRDRFLTIESCLCFGEEDPKDGWWKVRSLVEDFNKRALDVFVPGRLLTIDESFSFWSGADAKTSVGGLPHKSFQKDKPRGVGILFRTLACGTSSVVLQLEVQEGKQAMQLKEFQVRESKNEDAAYRAEKDAGRIYIYTVALCLRMTRPFWGTGRIVIMDSFFGSVATIQALLVVAGLYAIGIVKQGYSMFPKTSLEEWFKGGAHPRGSSTFLTSSYRKGAQATSAELTMMAIAWCIGKTVKFFVSSWGSNAPGNNFTKTYSGIEKDVNTGEMIRSSFTASFPQPEVLETFYEGFSAVDYNNKLRQGHLAIEENWHTHHWHIRVFSSIIGFCVANAYCAYANHLHQNHGTRPMEFKTFVDAIARALIFENQDGAQSSSSSSSSSLHHQAPPTHASRRRSSSSQEEQVRYLPFLCIIHPLIIFFRQRTRVSNITS